MSLYCASKQGSNWMLSSTSGLASSGSMQLITPPNIKTYCYLQSLLGIIGAKVNTQQLLIREANFFQIGVPVAWMLT